MIEKIYTFGTSFTAGGGYEWGGDYHKNRLLTENYNHINLPKNQFSWSWPGRLQNILDDNNQKIKVINYAKAGYGNERLYRKVFEVVTDKKFQRNKSLLVLEFSFMMRKEFFFRPLNDYIICNYHIIENGDVIGPDMAQTWDYDSEETKNLINKYPDLFNQFFNVTMDEDDIINKINQNIVFLLNFLDKNKIKYVTTSTPLIEPSLERFTDYNDAHKVFFETVDGKIYEDLEYFITENNLDIDSETNGRFKDFHAGYHGTYEIAKQVNNSLIDKGYIKCEKIPLDWTWLDKENNLI